MLESAFLISTLIEITYLIGVKELVKSSIFTGLLLGLSIFVFDVNLDLLWFTTFLRESPALSEHWWWMWMNGFLGVKWTTIHQIHYTLAFNAALISLRVSKLKNILLEKDAIGQLVDSKSSWYGIAPVFYFS